MRVVIRGGGDLATGIGLRLLRAGFEVIMLETATPTAIRRSVSMCEAVRKGEMRVEDLRGVLCANAKAAMEAVSVGDIAVCVDENCEMLPELRTDVLVDAIIAKRNLGTRKDMAPFVVALGPGFTAGIDCHAVIETMRGHDLGRVFYMEGARACEDTHEPGEVGGYTHERVMHTPCAGIYEPVCEIGQKVGAGDAVAYVEGQAVKAKIDGILRGQLSPGLSVFEGMKCADVDPRCKRIHCFTVSDKARALGGAVLEAAMHSRTISN